jgi:uncharacterized protein YoxC
MTTLAAGVISGKTLLFAHSFAIFQAQDAINSGNAKLLMVFIGLAAFALLVQAIAVVVVALGAVKAQKVILGHVEEIKAKVLPFVDKSHTLVNDLTPQVKEITAKTNLLITDMTPQVKDITAKVQALVGELSPQIVGITAKVHTITGHVEEITALAKDKVVEFGPTVSAANETAKQANETVRATIMDAGDKTRAQVDRVNVMVSGVLDATTKLGKAIEYGVTQPAREVSGFVSGAKVTVEHLVKRYGPLVNLSSLAGIVGLGKKKPAPSPYTPPKPAAATHVPVTPHAPEAMSTNETRLPSAFGSTKRDMDL